MTLSISISPLVQERLAKKAQAQGVDLETYVTKIVEADVEQAPSPPPHPDQATIDLLRKWDQEDRTDDPEEIARRTQEGEEFMRNLARNRFESEGPNARNLWPE